MKPAPFVLFTSLFLSLSPSALAITTSAQDDAIVDQIYNKLNSLFGGPTNQLFMMEFPGRVLNASTYTYETDSVFSELVKPQPVVEAEFRLTDSLFDVSRISGGPSGRSVAESYRRSLDLLLPQASASAFDDDQDQIMQWLEEVRPNETDAKGQPMTRMALFRKLNDDYLAARQKWKQERVDKVNNARAASDTEAALDAAARWLAVEGPARQAELAALWDDLVVRGDYHKVRAALGYLDIELEAGALETAKDRLRDSAMLALDESRTIYPVQLQPNDWFKSLTTDFQPVDLLMDPMLVRDRILSLENQLDRLQTQRALMVAGQRGDTTKLKSAVKAAQEKLDQAQSEQVKTFSRATLTIAEWAVNIYFTGSASGLPTAGEGGQPKSQLAKSTELAELSVLTNVNKEIEKKNAGPPLGPAEWKKLLEMQDKAIDAQTELTVTSRDLTDALAQLAEAESTDAKKALIIIDGKMEGVRREMQSLREVQRSAGPDVTVDGDGNATLTTAPPMFPSGQPKVGEWMDVIITSDSSSSRTASKLKTSASQTSWQVDLIFGSAGGSSSDSSSDSSFEDKAQSYSFEIAFRATKVTIDRGWFQPDFFARTSNMWKLASPNANGAGPLLISRGIPKAEGSVELSDAIAKANDAVLPAVPVSFIIVKDVTVKIKTEDQSASELKSFMDSRSSVGGGLLCFSASKSTADRSNSETTTTGMTSDSVIIRIPGPQILGWYLQYIPEDKSQLFSPAADKDSGIGSMFGLQTPAAKDEE